MVQFLKESVTYLVLSLSPIEMAERVQAGGCQAKLRSRQFVTSPAKFDFP